MAHALTAVPCDWDDPGLVLRDDTRDQALLLGLRDAGKLAGVFEWFAPRHAEQTVIC
ncbi:hypothetical protein [Terrabacter sp. BE26]|uniref:hypothetical protein n=1 Tax=Terrabacter sp. BE26 TaxID=2898152 RepID=UPI0035BE6B43